jgi:globin
MFAGPFHSVAIMNSVLRSSPPCGVSKFGSRRENLGVGGETGVWNPTPLSVWVEPQTGVADPVPRALFAERRPKHVEHLTWFIAESFGWPDRFTRELGFQHLIDVHRHLKITDEQRERFVAVYMEALDEAGPPNDERFLGGGAFPSGFGSRVAQQNSWAETIEAQPSQ